MHAFIQDLLGFKADFDAYQTYWQDLERQPDNVLLDLSVHIFGTLARMAEMQKRVRLMRPDSSLQGQGDSADSPSAFQLVEYRLKSPATAALAGNHGAGSSSSQSTVSSSTSVQ